MFRSNSTGLSWSLGRDRQGYKTPKKGTYFQLRINISQRTLEWKGCESLFQRLTEKRLWRNRQPVVYVLFPEPFSVKTSSCNTVRVARFRVISSGNLKHPHFRGTLPAFAQPGPTGPCYVHRTGCPSSHSMCNLPRTELNSLRLRETQLSLYSL